MNSYHCEQIDALLLVNKHLDGLTDAKRRALLKMTEDYFTFRREVDDFFAAHFSRICTRTCYQSRLSACCSREGIITFFADIVVNLLVSDSNDFESLMAVLNRENNGFKCVYLAETGCLWRLKPIVCQMYLCDRSKEEVFAKSPQLADEWELLGQKRKKFTWPDRPVLFDDIESYFLNAGCRSPLMYLHNSPGLLRVKQQAKHLE